MDFGIDPARGEAVDGFRRDPAREIAPLAREYRDRLMPPNGRRSWAACAASDSWTGGPRRNSVGRESTT